MLTAMAISRWPMVSDIDRAVEEEDADSNPGRLIHTESRLSVGLNSDRLDDAALHTHHVETVARFTRRDAGECIVCAVHYTDLTKPWANTDPKRGMEGVSRCWNGSEGDTGSGYLLVQVQAELGDMQVPVLLHPFSYDEIVKSSQNTVFLEHIARAAPYVGPQAWRTRIATRILLLAAILYISLVIFCVHVRELLRRALEVVSAFGRLPPEPRYRLFRGVGELLRRALGRRDRRCADSL